MSAAFITGAGRGIGKAIASTLGELGYSLFLVSRTESELTSTASEIQGEFPKIKVLCQAGDISDPEFVKVSFKQAIGKLGKINVAVNNAGVYKLGSTELSHQDFSKLLEINLTGAFLVATEALDHFRKNRSGYLINISSVCGITGFAGVGGYTASKFGLQGLNECLFREYAPEGIKVTAICPSWVNTVMSAGCPFPRDEIIQPKDIADTVRYLLTLSPGACPKEIVVECLKSPL